MNPQERQLVDDLFDRLSKVENAPRDPDAAAAIGEGLRKAPNAVYALVQTVLLQDEALKRAHDRIQELEAAGVREQPQSGGFLDSMRETVFGQAPQRGSVPNVRAPELPSRPTWNSGQVLQQAQGPGQSQGPGQYSQAPYGQPQPYGAPQAPMGGAPMGGGGGSFLGTAAAAAAGTIGGSLLLGSIRSMMGGSHQGFGDTAGLGGGVEDRRGDQSGGDLARDAGIGDIGSSGSRASDSSRTGLFDSDSNHDNSSSNHDNSSNNDNSQSGWSDTASNDDDHDDMDIESDDFGDDSDTV